MALLDNISPVGKLEAVKGANKQCNEPSFVYTRTPNICENGWYHSSRFLTHWDRVTHIYVSDLTSIDLDNGLSPGRRQVIIRTNAGILLIRRLGTDFSEFLVEILIFSFKKMRLKVSSAKRRPFCLGLNELTGKLQPAMFAEHVCYSHSVADSRSIVPCSNELNIHTCSCEYVVRNDVT